MPYTAYGLTIESELALPELVAADDDLLPDVSIRIASVAASGLEEGRQQGPFLWVSEDSVWLHVPQVARFLVQNGKTVLIDPAAGIDESSLRLFLFASIFGALLFQRGNLVLHGNAIRVGDACMVCVGDSGAGKSTLAAGLGQRGYEAFADDLVPVDIEGRALPGFPRIQLWKDAAINLGIETDRLGRVRSDIEKFNYPVPWTKRAALPIRWIYILNDAPIDGIRIEPIQGMARFKPLHDSIYRLRLLHGMALTSEHLGLCGRLAGRIHLARLTRPNSGFSLDAMMDRILADIAEHP